MNLKTSIGSQAHRILMILDYEGIPLNTSEIAMMMDVPRNQVNVVLASMRCRGLVESSRCETGRQHVWSITDDGRSDLLRLHDDLMHIAGEARRMMGET